MSHLGALGKALPKHLHRVQHGLRSGQKCRLVEPGQGEGLLQLLVRVLRVPVFDGVSSTNPTTAVPSPRLPVSSRTSCIPEGLAPTTRASLVIRRGPLSSQCSR